MSGKALLSCGSNWYTAWKSTKVTTINSSESHNPKTDDSKIKVFVADDHAVVRAGLKLLIGTDPGLVLCGEAGDGTVAIEQIVALKPDVAVVDLSMPGKSGLEITTELQSRVPSVKVLILTMHERAAYAKELINAGARGYGLKHANQQEFLQAIHTVAKGELYIDPSLADLLTKDIEKRKRAQEPGGKRPLSDREIEVLRMLAHGYSNKEIAVKLGISSKSIETYKSRSMLKIGLHTRADIVRYAIEQGWLQVAQQSD
jgi:DNA-binding NarL/FixJ family response regulator